MVRSVFVLLTAFIAAVVHAGPQLPIEQKLGTTLLQNSDPRWRPVFKNDDAVEVKMMVTLAGLEDDENTLHAHFYVIMSWNNPMLKWKPSDYGGVSQLSIPAKDVWVPDVDTFVNVKNRCHKLGDSPYPVLAMSDGTNVLAESYVYATHNCTDHDDEIECLFTWGSWVYNDKQLDLKADTSMSKIGYIDKWAAPNEDMEIVDVSFERTDWVYEEFGNQNFPQMHLKLKIKEVSDDDDDDKNSKEEL